MWCSSRSLYAMSGNNGSSSMILVVVMMGCCSLMSSAGLGVAYWQGYLCKWFPEMTFLCTGATTETPTPTPTATPTATPDPASKDTTAACDAAKKKCDPKKGKSRETCLKSAKKKC